MGVEIIDTDKRDLWQAIGRGALCRCPKCGEGKLFRAYLKVNDTCPVCGEELFHHRADDLPPYISIVIVGHILIGVMLEIEMRFQDVNPMWYLATLVPLAIVMPLALLPSIKGAVVGLQWANRMHGFDTTVRDPALPEEDPAIALAARRS
ncbi:MAG: DUF983 domain-containing protein [Devosia sp.]|nr:DUF983 domain-containing protein [Devosia sp.]